MLFRSFLSMFYALLCILIYVALRFDVRYAPGAVLALFHDTAITIGVFILTQKQFDLLTLAALLALIGYSNNDTIIVYDRVRETLHAEPKLSIEAAVNKATNETLGRTILTSLTTFLSAGALWLFGGPVIHDFAFTFMIGIVIGAYVLLKLPTQWLLMLLGVFVVAFGANFLRGGKSLVRLPRWAAAPVGLCTGVTSSALGVGGPIYVFYFTARGATPDQIRATVPAVFTFTTVARILVFTGVGLFNRDILLAAAVLLVPMGLGLYTGHRLHGRLSREQAVRIVGGLLLLSGMTLLMRAAALP